jgi:hypothetical protein
MNYRESIRRVSVLWCTEFGVKRLMLNQKAPSLTHLLLFVGCPVVMSVKGMLFHWWKMSRFWMKDHAVPSHLSLSSVVHHLCRAPVLQYVSCQFSDCSKMSGRGTSRALVYPGHQAEVISIIIDCWVRTGVPACVGWVLQSGRGFRQCISAGWQCQEMVQGGMKAGFWLVGGGSPLVRAFGWSDMRGSDRLLGRLFRTEVWVGDVCPLVLLGNVTHRGVWNCQQFIIIIIII